MCRLLALWRIDAKLLSELVGALESASRRDFVAEKLRLRAIRHDDGWGYALAYRRAGALTIAVYKSRRPMWEDEASFPSTGLVYGVVHTRKASHKMPIGGFTAHPFPISLPDGSVAFVAQNGGMNREGALKLLGVELDVSRVSDTLLYSLLLAKLYGEECGEPLERLFRALRRLHEKAYEEGLISRCANTAVLLVSPGEAVSLAVVRAQYYEKLNEYYDLYRCELGDGVVYASSTVARVLARRGYDFSRLEGNEVVVHADEGERRAKIP